MMTEEGISITRAKGGAHSNSIYLGVKLIIENEYRVVGCYYQEFPEYILGQTKQI